MKYCSNCGNELKENADVCIKCGKLLKQKNGKGIASLVLGIIAILWALLMISSITTGINGLQEYNTLDPKTYFIPYYIGYTLLALAPGIIGIILGYLSNKQRKNNIALTGIILSSGALLACIYTLIEFMKVV